MNIPFQARQTLRRCAALAIVILTVAAAVLVCATMWMQKFVTYTDGGVILNFDRSQIGVGQSPQANHRLPKADIVYTDKPYQEDLPTLNGYYLSDRELMKDPLAVRDKLAALPAGTPVMLDVKGYRGYFFYSTAVGGHTSGLYNIEKMDSLLAWLAQSDLYVIARMSSLRDFVSVWDKNTFGLRTSDGKLYVDSGDYGDGYWLDPTNSAVQNYLIDTLNELKTLGFDEVVLDNFRFPDTQDLAFTGDRAQAIQNLADKLTDSCANDGFAISFVSSDAGFELPEGRCRLYLENIAPEDAKNAWAQADVADKRRYLVFITDTPDERYDIENGILRPLQ